MTGREFKPGEVAMVDGALMLRSGGGWLYAATSGGSWSHAESSSADHITSRARPVVVIDLADRAVIAELLADYLADYRAAAPSEREIDRMQDALMRLADPKPPRPEEPTGLGAVVEDEEGSLLTRSRREGGAAWVAEGGHWFAWSDLTVVEVLSEGVQP